MTAPVVVVGDLLTDVVVVASGPVADDSDSPASVRLAGGGAGANAAAWFARAGVAAHLVTRVGRDPQGRVLVEDLSSGGVTVHATRDDGRPTGAIVVLVEGQRRTMLTDRGAAAALTPADLPAGLVESAAWLHLSGYVLLDDSSRQAGLAGLRRAAAAGVPASVDPASAAPLRAVGREAFLGWVGGAALLLPNREEAQVLTGLDDPAAAARDLTGQGREVVVTLGEEGALWCGGGAVEHHPASSVRVADPVGAGDAFAAGYVAARLRGRPAPAALAAGTALAAAAVQRTGGR